MELKSTEGLLFEKQLGKGGYGIANLYSDQQGNRIVIKSICKTKTIHRMVKREILAGKTLSHPHIAQFKTHFSDSEEDHLVFEYVQGKNFFHYFREDRKFKSFSDRKARMMFAQLADAVSYSHSKGVVHLDIKMENIMIDPATLTIKLIDFGLCNFVDVENKGKFRHRVGSKTYWAPEMIPDSYDAFNGYKVDVWCMGIVLFCWLHARLPYDPTTRNESTIAGEHPSPSYKWTLSRSAKDLLSKMLEVDPEKRISLSEVMNHPWFTQTKKTK